MTIVAYPGTFDPITLGHESLIRRAAKIFDDVIVAVALGAHKSPLFTVEERVSMAKEVFEDYSNVTVEPCEGLLVEFLRRRDCNVIIRGLRAVSDFEFENQIAFVHKTLSPSVETMMMMPDLEYTHIFSSLVREVARLGGDLEKFVSPTVARRLRQHLNRQGE